MMNFYLIRHGDKPNVAGDPELSELGIIQARLTGEYLQDKHISHIISSPLKRTVQTAREIAQFLHLDFSIDKRLTERLNFGDDPTLSMDQFFDIWDKTTIDRNFKPHLGDSSFGTGERVLAVIKECAQKYPGQNCALITHGGAIYDVLRNLFSDEYLKSVKSDFLQVGVMPCSITHLILSDDGYQLQKFGFVGHLPQPLK